MEMDREREGWKEEREEEREEQQKRGKCSEVLERGKWRMRWGRKGGDGVFFAEEVDDAEGYWNNKNAETGGEVKKLII